MKHIFKGTVYLLMYISTTLTAQEVVAPPAANALSSIGNTFISGEPGVRYEAMDIRGSALLFEEYLNGEVTLHDGKKISGRAAFNIDGTDKGGIVVLLPNGDAIDVKEELVQRMEVKENDKSRIFMPMRSSEISGTGQAFWIVELLYEDARYRFVKHHRKIHHAPETASPYASARNYHEFEDEIAYYLLGDDKWSKIRLTKGSVNAAVPQVGARLKGPVTEEAIIEALRESEKVRG